jgi:hypothetical protein
MSDVYHLKAFRLFDLAKGDSSGRAVPLAEWESEHLQGCEECQRLEAFFRRQLTERPLSYKNGEISPANGWYRNVCCDLELYVPAGKTFPDCRRHKNLPTSWRPFDEDVRKQSA